MPLFYLGFSAGEKIEERYSQTITYEAPVSVETTEDTTEASPVTPENAPGTTKKTDSVLPYSNEVKEALIAKLGSTHPLLEVARCESGYRQFNEDGSVLRGKANSQDYGAFQINLTYHKAAAEKMGLDLSTLEGNTDYALHLYQTQGLKPWSWSEHCWGKD